MVMFMNFKLLGNYIKRMSRSDVYNIAFKKGIVFSKEEVDIVYDYVKSNYNKFLYGNISALDILRDAELCLSKENYEKILVLYDQVKDKI